MSKIMRNIAYFSTASITSKILTALTAFIIVRYLLPEEYGIWSTSLMIVSLSSIFSFGTLETLVKKLPYYLDKNEAANLTKLESNVLGSVVISTILLIAFGFVLASLYLPADMMPFKNMIYLTIFSSSVSLLASYYYFRLTAYQEFKMVSVIDTIRSFLSIILVPAAVYAGLRGTLVSFLVIQFVILGLSISINNYSLKRMSPRFDLQYILELIKTGFPITMLWWIYMLQTSTGKIISITILGKEPAGYYGLGTNFLSIVVLIPMAISRVLYPKINEVIGRSDNKSMEQYVLYPTYILVLTVPIVLSYLIIFTPVLIFNFVNNYIPSINSLNILLVGFFFVTINRNGINYLIAKDLQNRILIYVGNSILFNVIVSISLIKFGMQIEGVAIGTTISGIIFTSHIWLMVFKQLEINMRIINLMKMFLPVLYPIVVALITQNLISRGMYSIFLVIVLAIISLLIYLFVIYLIPCYRSWMEVVSKKIHSLLNVKISINNIKLWN